MRVNTTIRFFTLAVLFTVMAAGFHTSTAQAKKKVTYYSIKTDTIVRVRLENDISSKNARVGDTFKSTTVDPIYSSGGVMLIPAGSTVFGRINSVRPAAKNGAPGSIGTSFTSVTLPNNRKAAISGTPVPLGEGGKNTVDNEGNVTAKKTSKRNLKFIGGGAAGGAIIGGIAGGGSGAAIGAAVGAGAGLIGKSVAKGHEVEVKSGTEFGVILNRAISLPRYAAVGPTP